MHIHAKQSEHNTMLRAELPDLYSSHEKEIRSLFIDNPACWKNFKALAALLETSGDDSAAGECHLGRIPSHIQQRLFGVNVDSFTSNSFGNIFSNIHPSSSMTPRSASVKNTTRLSKYIENNIISSPTDVSTFNEVNLWFDGFNTVVSNKCGDVDKATLAGNFAPAWIASKKVPPQILSGQVVLMGCKGSNNYYHWMTDILPKFAIMEKAGIELSRNTKYVFTNISSDFQIDTLKYLGIAEDQIYQTNIQGQHLHVDELVVPNLTNTMGLTMGEWLPDYLRNIFNVQSIKPKFRKILVTRNANTSHGRGINNIAEFNQHFFDRGYEIIFPEKHTVMEQAKLFSEATHVVGPHGAGLTNLLFCQPGTKVYELYGDHLAPCYWAMSELSGLDYLNHNCSDFDFKNSSKLATAKSLSIRRSCSFSVDLSNLNEIYI